MDTTFSKTYQCDELAETPQPAVLPHYFYPFASTEGGRDGIFVEVCPEHGHPWQGTFAFGHVAPKGASGIFTTPDPLRVCVVAKGAGYFVSASEPTSWELVRVTPITDVRPVHAQGIIVFASFTDLVAYGRTGIKWRTKRLSWDNLKITEVTDNLIRGESWDIRSEAVAYFLVDLATGTSQGGVEDS
jgi:hypothetical protein